MSDYLTQLVARNLGLADVVQLRPTALFAPERAAEPFGEAGEFVDAPTVPAARQIQSHPPAEQARPDALQAPAEPPQLLSKPTSVGQRSISEPPARSITPADDLSVPTDRALRRTPAQLAPLPSPAFALQPAPINTPPMRDTLSPAAPVAAPQRMMIEQPTLAPEPPIVIKRVDAAQPAQSLLVMPQPSSNVVQPARRAPPAAATQPSLAAPEPTIHVTIGRIEVRATPPPSPAARPKSAPAPTMSLDDYLRERGGGRR